MILDYKKSNNNLLMDVCQGDIMQFEALKKASISTFLIKFENYVNSLKTAQ